MKILVLSLYYEPDRCQSNGPIIRALCEDWAAAGHEVTVLASFPHYSCPAVWPEYRRRLLQWDRVGPVRVIRSYIYVAPGRSSLGRILNYLSLQYLFARCRSAEWASGRDLRNLSAADDRDLRLAAEPDQASAILL
jgi:hypothetical protein